MTSQNPNKTNILIVAGEASGDVHAAKLVESVRKINSQVNFFGMGGKNMRAAGVDIIIPMDELAVVGLYDVLANLPKIYAAYKLFKDILFNNAPALIILVDYPGLNLRLAKIAKKARVKVLYYISPKLWASRPGRVKIIKKYVDEMGVIFPFEIDFYRQYNVSAHFVGNPLINVESITPKEAFSKFGLNSSEKVIGIFPGSRKSEITRILPVMTEAAKLIRNSCPNVQFILPVSSSLNEEDLKKVPNCYFDEYDGYLEIMDSCQERCIYAEGHENQNQQPENKKNILIKVVFEPVNNVIPICDAIIATSGTVTLEVALLKVPLVIVYKIFPSFIPIKKIINIPYIGLPNIIAGKKIVKELLQKEANPREIYEEINKILHNETYRQTMINELDTIKEKLTMEKTEDLAELVNDMLRKKGE